MWGASHPSRLPCVRATSRVDTATARSATPRTSSRRRAGRRSGGNHHQASSKPTPLSGSVTA